MTATARRRFSKSGNLPRRIRTVYDTMTGIILALFANFVLLRLYMLFAVDTGSGLVRAAQETILGIGKDCFFILLFSAAIAIPLLIVTLLTKEGRWRRLAAGLTAWLLLCLTGLLANVLFAYYRFTHTWLDPELFRHYLLQIGHFGASITSGDLSLSSFILLSLLWVAVATAGLLVPLRLHRLKRAGVCLAALIVVAGGLSQACMSSTGDLGENLLTQFIIAAVPRKVPDIAFDRETLFDRCLEGSYEFPEVDYPFYRRSITENTKPILVNLPAKKPTIIVIFMESFSAAFLDRNLREAIELTPETEKLIGKSLYLSTFYANGVQTTRGIFASLCSVLPHFGSQISTNYPTLTLECLPCILKEYGYRSIYLQSHDLDFDNEANSFRGMGFDRLIGFEELPPEIKNSQKAGWGISDERLFEVAETIIAEESSRPRFLTIMTLTNHHPFEVPDDAFERYSPDRIEHRFRNTIHYADYALGRFIQRLEERGLLKNTIMIVTADTSQPMKEHDDNVMLIDHAYEENFRIPFLIYAPDYIRAAASYDFVASQVDILPTLLPLLGINRSKNAFMGQDVFADGTCHWAVMTQPFGKRNMVMRYQNYKYHYTTFRKRERFYDLAADPREANPLGSIADRQIAADMPVFLQRTIRTLNVAIETNRVYPPGSRSCGDKVDGSDIALGK